MNLTLKGWKTYLASWVMAGLGVALAFDWITKEQFAALITVASAVGLGALRAGVKDVQKKIEKAGTPGDPI
jgi:uncharacterized membrane protein YhiD involved in acid resistance